jgi:Ca-activated chloride channel family protein
VTTGRTVPLLVGCLVGIIGVIGSMLVFAERIDWQNCITLNVNVSTEKRDVVKELAKDFTDTRPVVDYRCGRVKVEALNSGEAAEYFRTNGWRNTEFSYPDVWLPSTSMWAAHVEHIVGEDLFDGEDDSITQSPLVIAMPRNQAEVVTKKYGNLDWSVLEKLSAPDFRWADLGHPEWGKFTMGKDKPTLSSSGLAATVAAHHAATGSPAELTLEDVDDDAVRTWLGGLERSVTHYSDDSVVFLDNLYREDENNEAPYIEAMVMQEQLAYRYNTGAFSDGRKAPKNPFVAFQPSDNPVVLDHPFFVVSHGDEDEQNKRQLAAQFREFLLDDEQQERFQEEGFRDSQGVATEKLATTVGSERELSTPSLRTPTGEVIDRILANWNEVRVRGKVHLLLDVSGSMGYPISKDDPRTKLDVVKSAVQGVLEKLDDEIKVSVWTIDPESPIREPLEPAGEVRDALIEKVNSLEPSGAESTPLFSVTRSAYEGLRGDSGKNEFRAIVLLTDGESQGESTSAEAELFDTIASDAAREDEDNGRSVHIFTVAYGEHAKKEVLEELATTTNGRMYKAGQTINDGDGNDGDIDKVLRSVFSHF